MTDYLDELRESARQVVAGAGTAASEDATWPQMVELGWLLTAVPEELDGLGLGLREVCALHTELGRGLSQAPLLPAQMALEALCASERADTADWVGRFTAGENVTAPLVEPALQLCDGVLSGVAEAVQSADKASHALVWTAAGDCVVLVDLAAAGVELVERRTWDSTRRLFDLRLNGVAIDTQQVLASGGAAAALVDRVRTLRDFALAADSLGGGEATLAMTVEHLCTRKQFGRPLALFQALKHRCADLKTLLAAAQALLENGLLGLQHRDGGQEAATAAALAAALAAKKAKYLACSVYATVTEEALQLHGGIGMAVEYPCHLYLKRSMLNEHLGASEDHYTAAIADAFLAGLA